MVVSNQGLLIPYGKRQKVKQRAGAKNRRFLPVRQKPSGFYRTLFELSVLNEVKQWVLLTVAFPFPFPFLVGNREQGTGKGKPKQKAMVYTLHEVLWVT